MEHVRHVKKKVREDLHYCQHTGEDFEWGAAVTYCYEGADGRLFVSNEEYGSQVNFCPMCGYEAKEKI